MVIYIKKLYRVFFAQRKTVFAGHLRLNIDRSYSRNVFLPLSNSDISHPFLKTIKVDSPNYTNVRRLKIQVVPKPESQSGDSFALSVSQKYVDTAVPIISSFNGENISFDEAQNLIQVDWANNSAEEILSGFKKLSYYAKDNEEDFFDDKYTNIREAMIVKLSTNPSPFSFEQLGDILLHLQGWKLKNEPDLKVVQKFISALDDATKVGCRKRSADEMLAIADLWLGLKMWRKVTYFNCIVKRLGEKPQKLNSANFVRFIFYINLCRKSRINMYEVEYRFEKLVNDLTIDDIGVVCMAFFKAETSFRSNILIGRILTKTLLYVDVIHEISLASIMKVVRHTMGFENYRLFSILLRDLIPQLPRLGLQCLTHILHATTSIRLYNDVLVDQMLKRYEVEIKSARLKDIEEIVIAMAVFNYKSDHYLYQVIIDELISGSREVEFQKFPKLLMSTLRYLSQMDIYPKSLIVRALDPDNLKKVYGERVQGFGCELLVLNHSIKIDMPDYDGPTLSKAQAQYLAKKYKFSLSLDEKKIKNLADNFLMEVLHECQDIFGTTTAAHANQVLPHFDRPDIVICLDESKNAVPVEHIFAAMDEDAIKYPPDVTINNPKWIVLIPATLKFYTRDSMLMCGILSSKIRQLQRIGYLPHHISVKHWIDLKYDERKEYLKSILFS